VTIGWKSRVNNQLKVLRAMRNWSQAELAQRLDVSRQAVNAIETGKYDPSLPLAFKLARLFGMPIEEIFDDGFKGQDDGLLNPRKAARRGSSGLS
jgi:Predicted transcriptional regulators